MEKESYGIRGHCKTRGPLRVLCVLRTLESQKKELVEQIEVACMSRPLGNQDCLSLRGRLGFADSCVDGWR